MTPTAKPAAVLPRPRPPQRQGPPGPTRWPELNAAIARLPGYADGDVDWQVSDRYGSWGTTELGTRRVTISPRTPVKRLYDVAVHEWSHVVSMRDYDNQVQTALDALNGYFGGREMKGAEYAADCMAVLGGARWTNYTSCTDSRWRDGAARLWRGGRL